jgi:hypothetical protein
MSDPTEGSPDEARPEDTVIDVADVGDDGGEDFHPFDELDDDFKPGPAVRVMGADGLPTTIDQTSESDIPSLSRQTLVCMGDFSKFVTRDTWGNITREFSPSEVTRQPNGKWTVNDDAGHLAAEVHPIRPPCRHYVRQKTTLSLNAKHFQYSRLCAARRTTEGTFMTVRDSGVWACDMREPIDLDSIKALDDFDALKIAQGENREYFSIFQAPVDGLFEHPKPKEN